MEQSETTETKGPGVEGVTTSDNPEASPSPSQETVATEAPAPSPETTETTAEYQPRYLGKKYADLSQLEQAVSEKDRTINQSFQEKNELTARLAAMEQALKEVGIQTPVAPPQHPVAPQPQVDVDTLVEQKLRPIKQQMALREEESALDEVIRMKPHLGKVREHIRASWRLAGNVPLEAVVNDFDTLVNVGRNISKEDSAAKKEEHVETGRNVTAVSESKLDEKRRAAFQTGSLEAIANTLPDDLGLR